MSIFPSGDALLPGGELVRKSEVWKDEGGFLVFNKFRGGSYLEPFLSRVKEVSDRQNSLERGKIRRGGGKTCEGSF